MSNQHFASRTKLNYSRGLKNIPESQLSNFTFRLFSNPLALNRIQNEIKNEVIPTPIPPIPPIPPEPTYNNKMVGIFSPSTLLADKDTIDSIKYYWSVVPQFEPFLILEYDGTKEDLIKTLDKAYSLGKIYIFGFTTSSSLANSLDWLNKHPNVQGVTISATSAFLTIPKKIYRTLPDTTITFEIKQFSIFNGVPGNGAIYYIYNKTQVICESYKIELQKYCKQYGGIRLIEYPYNSLSELTYTNVQTTIQQIYDDMSNNGYTKSSICLSMVDFTEEFYPLFNSGMANVSALGASYFDLDLTSVSFMPNSLEDSKTYFNNILYVPIPEGLMPTKLRFNTPNPPVNTYLALNSLNILYQLNEYGGYVNQLGTYSVGYILDPVTRDNVAYPTVFLAQYQQSINKFKDLSIIYEDQDNTLFECILSP
jgi:hypothetical protein